MAKLTPEQTAVTEKCKGGKSWGCKHQEHDKGRDIICYRCQNCIGCVNCCERAAELICLYCHNFATKTGVNIHGNIVPNIKVPRVRIDTGWITHHPLTDKVNNLKL